MRYLIKHKTTRMSKFILRYSQGERSTTQPRINSKSLYTGNLLPAFQCCTLKTLGLQLNNKKHIVVIVVVV